MALGDNNYPKYGQSHKTRSATATGASSTTNNTPPNTILIGTVGANGAMLTKGSLLPLVSNTACAAYLFLSKDVGATKQFIAAVAVPAYTQAAATPPTESLFAYSEDAPKRLEAGDQLYLGLSSAQASGIIGNFDWTEF
jgi:hypothetical protein